MFEGKNISIEVNNKIIISNLSFVLNKNDRLAIIGEEGNGKSTLLKSLCSNCDYAKIEGVINYKGNSVGYLAQSLDSQFLKLLVYNFLFSEDVDYYNKINEFYGFLPELMLDETILEKQLRFLSGGEKVKVQLLKVLLDNPDILLLDEPTNDLDIATLEWLEGFINRCSKPIIYVSHDETLLANTANMILHLELTHKKTKAKHTLEKNNYETYVEQRISYISKTNQVARKEKQEFNKQQEKLTQVMQKVHHEQDTISRSNPHGGRLLKKKMKSLKSQERRLENQELTKKIDVEESINIFFENASMPASKVIADIKIESLKINDLVLCENINFKITGNNKIAIIGKNGVGKTTLLKQIHEDLKTRTDISVGYMPQDYDSILSKYKTPIDFIGVTHKDDISLIRSYMGNLNFTVEEMESNITNLSGGSKAKLILLKLIYDKNNVLILDEPTRNVSPLSNPVIRKALQNFSGTIISISHDRKYISEVANLVYELDKTGIKLMHNNLL